LLKIAIFPASKKIETLAYNFSKTWVKNTKNPHLGGFFRLIT
jgi:hypothetical protein